MRKTIDAAFVIGRRDFVATVYSKTFLFFLTFPLIIVAISILFGNVTEKMAREDMRPTVAVIADLAEFNAISAAREGLVKGFGEGELPDLVRAEPDYVIEGQVKDLLASRDKKILAVLTGGIQKPRLTGSVSQTGSIRSQLTLILDEARQRRAIAGARLAIVPVDIALVRVDETAGSLASLRAVTARMGQLLLFALAALLAGMLLSNLIEEKSNRVIEVLAAAVPIDAIFLGKLFSMLAVSLVGLTVWGTGTLVGLSIWPIEGGGLPEPAVGWPLFAILLLLYYSTNYLLLGALFLGIGSQASSVREVQILSMPVTVGQLLLFLFASVAVGKFDSFLAVAAAIFPYSSPMVMVSRAAQTPELWPHLLALLWQILWVWLTVKLGASLFRRNVMKSGAGGEAAGAKRARA